MELGLIILIALFILLVMGIAIFLIWPIRKRIFILPFIQWFHRQQPTLTKAEQQMLEAGDLWWEKQFFTGKPNWQELLKIEKPELTAEEKNFLDHTVEKLCEQIDNWKIEEELHNLPEELWDFIKKEGFWALGIEKKYGGHEFSPLAQSAIINKIASRSYSVAVMIMVPNALGPPEFLKLYGTQEQRDYYLPRVARGEEICCFALTSPSAGSDAMSITNGGVVCKRIYEGREMVGIRLNWDKRYITLAPKATLIGLAFRLYDPEHLMGNQENLGITLALVPSHLKGVEIGKRHDPLNFAFLNGPTRGEDVFIPLDFIIGGVEKKGQGWQMLMEGLAIGRGISLPALVTGVQKICFRMSGAYSFIRRQFHRSISEFEGIQEAMAHIAGYTYLTEATRLFTALAVKKGTRPAVASAIAKYHLTEFARKTVNHAMDIHGGYGIQMGPHNYLGHLYMSSPISITVEGANILTRNLMIFGQGVIRGHPYLRAEINAASNIRDPVQIKQFDHLIFKHIKMVVAQFASAFMQGITGGFFIRTRMKTSLKKSLQQLTRMSTAFSLLSNITLIVVGGKLKFKESLSARLGDVLSHLYLASAVIKYFHDHGQKDAERCFAEWSLQYCLYEIHQAISAITHNFSPRWFGSLLKFLIFPWGQKYFYPSHQLSFHLARQMQHDLNLRDRLSDYCYISQDQKDACGRVEVAFQQLWHHRELYAKLEKVLKPANLQNDCLHQIQSAYNKGLLTEQEYEQLCTLETLRGNALKVDEF